MYTFISYHRLQLVQSRRGKYIVVLAAKYVAANGVH